MAVAAPIVGAVVPPTLIFDWSIAPEMRIALAVVAVGLLGFHLVNIFGTRSKLKHFDLSDPKVAHWDPVDVRRLRRSEIFAGCVSPAAVLVLILLTPPRWWTLLLICIAFGLSQVIYEPVEREIGFLVDDGDKETGTQFFRKRSLLGPTGVKKSLDEMEAKGYGQGFGIWKGLIALGKEPWQPGLSRTRFVIIVVLILSAAMAGASAGSVFVHENVISEKSAEGGKEGGGNGESDGGTKGGDKNGNEGEGQVAEVEKQGGGTTDPSKHHCEFIPPSSIPARAQDDLLALYYGGDTLDATKPPGTNIGGCPGQVFSLLLPDGERFFYVIGRRDGEVRSVAVTSRAMGSQIFLAPSAQPVLDLIYQGKVPLGGYPRRDLKGTTSEGDMVPITTANGTLVLVRAHKVLKYRTSYASPYIELPITVGVAWIAAMRSTGKWLWPFPPIRTKGDIVFEFAARVGGKKTEVSIDYDVETGGATLDDLSYGLPQEQLSQSELEAFAKRAR